MTMMPLRIGFVGVGRIGRMHARIVAQNASGARVTAVYDLSPQIARDVADELGAQVMPSLEDLVTSRVVDAVAICSSTDTHVPAIEMSALAGKPVFCEKPVSLSLSEIDRVVDAVTASGIPFMVGFNRRFDPGHAAVGQAVLSGEIGDVHLVRITSRDPSPPPLGYVKVSGGLFMDMAIHDFDMARFVVGTPVVSVYAQGGVRIDPAIGALGDIDTAVTVLTHACGAITTIDNSRQASYGYDQRVEVFGSKGMAISGNQKAHHMALHNETGVRGQALQAFFLERYAESYQREWAAFTRFVHQGGPSPVSISDGRAPIVIAEAAAQSMREGRPVAIQGG